MGPNDAVDEGPVEKNGSGSMVKVRSTGDNELEGRLEEMA